MADVARETQQLLAAYREHHGPTAGREAAIVAGLRTRIDGGDPGPDVPPPSVAPPASGWPALSIVGLVALIGAAIPGVAWLAASAGSDPRSRVDPPSVPALAAEQLREPAGAVAIAAAPPAPQKQRPRDSPRVVKATAKPAKAPNSEADGLQAELRLIKQAHAALRGGQPKRAVVLLDKHAREFPRGVLAAERKVSRASALCALGRRDAAQAEVRKFLRAHPGSPLSQRARNVCR